MVSEIFGIEIANGRAEDVSAAVAIVTVEKSWLSAERLHLWSVAFNRLDPEFGDWIPHPAKRINET